MPFFPFAFQNPTSTTTSTTATQNPPPPPNPLLSNLPSILSTLQSSAHAAVSKLCPVGPLPSSPLLFPPLFARIPSSGAPPPPPSPDKPTTSSSSSHPKPNSPKSNSNVGFKGSNVAARLDGVPVYALSNAHGEIVLVSAPDAGKSLGLFCFKKEDAEAILREMRAMDTEMRHDGSSVVPVALNKVFQLKLDGISLRFIPDSSQVVKALKEKEKAGESTGGGFNGVPVFQSKSLFVKSGNKKYRPVFFRKEDLDDSLARVSKEKRRLNPGMRVGDIQVEVFEEILKTMVDGSTRKWDDVVFVPPGFKMPAYQK